MFVRGVRGATTVDENTTDSILSATKELIEIIIEKNDIHEEDIASILFSVTEDINAEFPAKAARDMGFTETPLLCLNEITVPDRIQKCIRVLFHVNTEKKPKDIHHIYLKGATILRPDHSTQT